jgi:hypothetical protein
MRLSVNHDKGWCGATIACYASLFMFILGDDITMAIYIHRYNIKATMITQFQAIDTRIKAQQLILDNVQAVFICQDFPNEERKEDEKEKSR